MKELAADESLSEDARESAKKAFEVLLSSQLLDIEQTAALKKLESEAQFVNQQAQIERSAEQDAALEKLASETHFKRKKLEAELEAGVDEMEEWLKRHRLARHAETIAGVAGLHVSVWPLMFWWRSTLNPCRVCRDAAPGDLQYLTEDNIAEIGTPPTLALRCCCG